MTDLHEGSQPPEHPPPPAGRTAGRTARSGGPDEEAKGTNPWRLAILAGLLAFLGLRGGWAPLVVVLGVVVMIFLHELGHYLTAKWGGMKVTEFFIGFGPRIWSFRRGETEYGLKVIPAGAYVKIIGMNDLDEVDPADEARTYRRASFPRRFSVAVAGSTMHFLQALVLLFVLYAFVGVPGGSLTEDRAWEVAEVLPDSAAAEAGLEPGDRLVSADGQRFETFTAFAGYVAARPGETMPMVLERDGRQVAVETTIGSLESDPTLGLLGVRRELVTTTVGPITAVGRTVSDLTEQTTATLGFIGSFFSPSGIAEFVGDVATGRDDSQPIEAPAGSPPGTETAERPDDNRIISIVGAIGIGADLTESGLLGFLLFFVGINITIGIFNLLPVLPLDGGHVVIAVYERIREALRPGEGRYLVDMTRLLPFVYAVFVVLVMLGVTTIYLDVIDPVQL